MSLDFYSLLMTENDDADDETQTSTDAQSRFAKFDSLNNIDSEESTDDGDDNDDDDDDVLSPEDDTTADSDSGVDTNTSTSDLTEQATSDSRSSRVWSDATITNTTDTDSDSDSDSPETTSLSGDNSVNSSDDISDSTASVDSNQHSSEADPDGSQRDSGRMWNQLSRSNSPEEMHPTGNQSDDSSVNLDQTDSSEEITTDNDLTNENSVNPDQINSPVNPQSQSQSQSQPQPQPSSSLGDSASAGSTQTDTNAIADGSQALLLGKDNPGTWNTGFSHILEPQHPQNLLLLVPAGETVDILRVCQEHPSWDGGEIIIIKAGASVPGDMSVSELSGDGMDESIETHQISDQTDLSRLGILITQVLDNWQNPDQNTVCSVHTLQAFLQYLSPQKVFQFLYTLSRRLQSADIETTYLMTPSDGDRTINTLRPIFDTVIEK